jgi:hypothetical protein
MNYSREVLQMTERAPEDIKASGEHMMAIHEDLAASGELVGAEGLTGPEAARIVTTTVSARRSRRTSALGLDVASPRSPKRPQGTQPWALSRSSIRAAVLRCGLMAR